MPGRLRPMGLPNFFVSVSVPPSLYYFIQLSRVLATASNLGKCESPDKFVIILPKPE